MWEIAYAIKICNIKAKFSAASLSTDSLLDEIFYCFDF